MKNSLIYTIATGVLIPLHSTGVTGPMVIQDGRVVFVNAYLHSVI